MICIARSIGRGRSAVADLDRIRGKCSASEAKELDVLVRAVERTMAAYQDGYAESDLKKWNAAKGALAEFTTAMASPVVSSSQRAMA